MIILGIRAIKLYQLTLNLAEIRSSFGAVRHSPEVIITVDADAHQDTVTLNAKFTLSPVRIFLPSV